MYLEPIHHSIAIIISPGLLKKPSNCSLCFYHVSFEASAQTATKAVLQTKSFMSFSCLNPLIGPQNKIETPYHSSQSLRDTAPSSLSNPIFITQPHHPNQ